MATPRRQPHPSLSLTRLLRTAGAVVLLALVAGCATNPVTGEQDFVLLSEDQEIRIGRQEHPKILERFGRYPDEALQEYVQSLGEELAAESHRTDLIYRFTVLDSPDVNAFALPGGYIYITRGLMAYLDTEAELAAVLGHELGHVTARHSVRQVSAAQAMDLGFTLGSIFAPELRQQGVQDLFNVLGTALVRGYGREHELEADRLGAGYLARTGRDPRAMLEVLRVLKAQEQFAKQQAEEEGREPSSYHGLFATHPDNDRRLQEVIQAAGGLRPGGGGQPPRREAYLRRLEGLTFGPSARQGVLRGSRFFHKDLDFGLSFPPQWRVENRPDRLVATAPGGAAVLQMTVEDRNKRIGPEAFLRRRLERERLAEGRPVSPAGLEGYTGVTALQTPFGRRQARVGVVFHGRRAFLFLTAAKAEREPADLREDFLATVESFHPLTAREQELAEPLRIQVITAERGRGYAELANGSRIPHHPEAQLRLLNQDYPDGRPRPGELIKIVK